MSPFAKAIEYQKIANIVQVVMKLRAKTVNVHLHRASMRVVKMSLRYRRRLFPIFSFVILTSPCLKIRRSLWAREFPDVVLKFISKYKKIKVLRHITAVSTPTESLIEINISVNDKKGF